MMHLYIKIYNYSINKRVYRVIFYAQFVYFDLSNVLTFNDPFIETNIFISGRGGVVVERRTSNREVHGLIPSRVTMLCRWAGILTP